MWLEVQFWDRREETSVQEFDEGARATSSSSSSSSGYPSSDSGESVVQVVLALVGCIVLTS